jgi:hypothetical protein
MKAKKNTVETALEGSKWTDQCPLASVAHCRSTSVKRGSLVKKKESEQSRGKLVEVLGRNLALV